MVLVFAIENHGSDFRCFSVFAKIKKGYVSFSKRIFKNKHVNSKWPFAIRSFRQIRPLILKTALSYSWTTFNKVRFDETFLAAIWSNVSQIIANSCRFFFISSRNPNSHYNFYFRHFFARLVNAWYFLNGRNNKSMRTRIGLSNSNNYFLELF